MLIGKKCGMPEDDLQIRWRKIGKIRREIKCADIGTKVIAEKDPYVSGHVKEVTVKVMSVKETKQTDTASRDTKLADTGLTVKLDVLEETHVSIFTRKNKLIHKKILILILELRLMSFRGKDKT